MEFDDRRAHGGSGASAMFDDSASGAQPHDAKSNCNACGPSLGKHAGESISSLSPSWKGPARQGRLNGWLVVGACFCLTLTLGETFWTFGVFFRPIQQESGWNRAVVSSSFMALLMGHSLSVIASGRCGREIYEANRGPRAGALNGRDPLRIGIKKTSSFRQPLFGRRPENLTYQAGVGDHAV